MFSYIVSTAVSGGRPEAAVRSAGWQCLDAIWQEEGWNVVHELRHNDHHNMETEHEGRDGVQRMWPLLQIARSQSSHDNATRHDTHAQTKAKGWKAHQT